MDFKRPYWGKPKVNAPSLRGLEGRVGWLVIKTWTGVDLLVTAGAGHGPDVLRVFFWPKKMGEILLVWWRASLLEASRHFRRVLGGFGIFLKCVILFFWGGNDITWRCGEHQENRESFGIFRIKIVTHILGYTLKPNGLFLHRPKNLFTPKCGGKGPPKMANILLMEAPPGMYKAL